MASVHGGDDDPRGGIGAFDFSAIEEMDPSLGMHCYVMVCSVVELLPRGRRLSAPLEVSPKPLPHLKLHCDPSAAPRRAVRAPHTTLPLSCCSVFVCAADGYHILYDRECPFELRLQVRTLPSSW
jgi:hypothetical protein